MATTLINQILGPPGTPQEVKDLRKSSYDMHEQIGTAVVFKHRWNKKDLDNGLTWLCPLHDDLYGDRDVSFDPICFGTGYVGGYADGQIIYVTLQDVQETQIKITPQGILTMDMHPAMTAPWTPLMGDGDLIIAAEFIPGTWTIDDTFERYVLRDVTPVTMRGPGWGRQSGILITRQIISQQAAIDKLPIDHPLYEVPIVFDYTNVPAQPTPPYVPEPTDFNYSEYSVSVKVHGILPDIPPVEGTQSHRSADVRVVGEDPNPGTVFDW